MNMADAMDDEADASAAAETARQVTVQALPRCSGCRSSICAVCVVPEIEKAENDEDVEMKEVPEQDLDAVIDAATREALVAVPPVSRRLAWALTGRWRCGRRWLLRCSAGVAWIAFGCSSGRLQSVPAG